MEKLVLIWKYWRKRNFFSHWLKKEKTKKNLTNIIKFSVDTSKDQAFKHIWNVCSEPSEILKLTKSIESLRLIMNRTLTDNTKHCRCYQFSIFKISKRTLNAPHVHRSLTTSKLFIYSCIIIYLRIPSLLIAKKKITKEKIQTSFMTHLSNR